MVISFSYKGASAVRIMYYRWPADVQQPGRARRCCSSRAAHIFTRFLCILKLLLLSPFSVCSFAAYLCVIIVLYYSCVVLYYIYRLYTCGVFEVRWFFGNESFDCIKSLTGERSIWKIDLEMRSFCWVIIIVRIMMFRCYRYCGLFFKLENELEFIIFRIVCKAVYLYITNKLNNVHNVTFTFYVFWLAKLISI